MSEPPSASPQPLKFPRHSRLLSSREFSRILKVGRGTRSDHLTVIAAPGETPTSRLGLIAGRKVGKAHDRNRLKRVVREVFRLEILPRDQALDMVVRFLPGSGSTPSGKVRDEFRRAAEKLGFPLTTPDPRKPRNTPSGSTEHP